ncbi:MAG: DUF4258 domain-containing protein [Ferruginibacter sp.]
MIKKYLPFIVLLAAALLFWYVKSNQRMHYPAHEGENNITVPAKTDEGFSRHPDKIIYSKHARCRMACRHIDESEVKEIIENGNVNYAKIEEDERCKTYPIEGTTHDKQYVRIVVAPKQNDLVIVTVIDLKNEWQCDCK